MQRAAQQPRARTTSPARGALAANRVRVVVRVARDAVAAMAAKSEEVWANLPERVRADPDLPIFAARDEIVRAIATKATTLIVGETGSGKSTQVPQFLLKAGLAAAAKGRRCCVTQPRRVAVARRADVVVTRRGDAAAATWIFRGDDECSRREVNR